MQTEQLRLVRAETHDADGIRQVMNGVGASGTERNGIDRLVTPDDVVRWLRALDGRGVMLLARVGAKPAGTAILEPGDTAGSARLRVWVLPSYRRRGIGAELARVAAQQAKTLGYTRVVGFLPPDNDVARQFFAAAGIEAA